MNFKNIKLKYLLLNLFILLFYPCVKAYATKSLLVLSDTCTIMGLVAIIFGVINSLFLHGDFDITGFVAHRRFAQDKQDFDVYMKNQEEKRRGSFNYPLLCAFLLLLIAYLISLFI